MRDGENKFGRGLYRLTELADYEVADRNPDVRGWNVISADNKTIGKVDELIVDLDAMKVRYLDIIINKDINDAGTENRHLLIPIGAAQLDDKDDIVRVNDIETVTLLKLPAYEGGKISREYEKNLRRSISGEYNPETEECGFYDNFLYNDDKFYSSRGGLLVTLSDEYKFKVLGTHPDVRGWDAFTSDNNKAGVVSEIIIDTRLYKIRYIDIYTHEPGRHFLIPIGLVSLSDSENKVFIDLKSEELETYPVYSGGEIKRDYEKLLHNSIRRNLPVKKHAEFYSHKHYDDSRFFHS